MWHGTRDTWHVTCDTWHVTRDTWHVWGGWTFSQNFSFLALTVCDFWYYEDLEEKADLINQWISNEAVCRTAPATPGLSIRLLHIDLNAIYQVGLCLYIGYSLSLNPLLSSLFFCRLTWESIKYHARALQTLAVIKPHSTLTNTLNILHRTIQVHVYFTAHYTV